MAPTIGANETYSSTTTTRTLTLAQTLVVLHILVVLPNTILPITGCGHFVSKQCNQPIMTHYLTKNLQTEPKQDNQHW